MELLNESISENLLSDLSNTDLSEKDALRHYHFHLSEFKPYEHDRVKHALDRTASSMLNLLSMNGINKKHNDVVKKLTKALQSYRGAQKSAKMPNGATYAKKFIHQVAMKPFFKFKVSKNQVQFLL